MSPLARALCSLGLCTSISLFTSLTACSVEPAPAPCTGVNCDASIPDAPDAPDTGEHPDAEVEEAGVPDAEPDAGDDGGIVVPTLADYLRCHSPTDCPVGLGTCVRELALHRPDHGTSVIALSAIDPRVADGEGLCTRECTRDPNVCDELALFDAHGDRVPFTCHVVALGSAPYPSPAPPFPFDDALDLDGLEHGRPFAALCRPPLELDPSHTSELCKPCDGASGCAGATCWSFASDAPASAGEQGVCLEAASDVCPFGFVARGTEAPLCVPRTETCGACVDHDGDGRGAGHCASPRFDCDDANPDAYFDGPSSTHAFPEHCGAHDFNCNGLSDAAEQIGLEPYRAFHCERCGDDADGRVVQQGTDAEATLECVDGVVRVAACTAPMRVHCAGDPRVTGCEATPLAGGRPYYRDRDRDGHGDPALIALACPGGAAPEGYVDRDDDCDDTNDLVSPDAFDDCECWNDCAAPGARVDDDCDGRFDDDVRNVPWSWDLDADGAGAAPFGEQVFCGAPAPSTVPFAARTDCDDADPTAFGRHVAVADASGVIVAYPMDVAPPRVAGGLALVEVAASTEVCDLTDDDCDGVIDEDVTPTFHRDLDGDLHGDPSTSLELCTAPAGWVLDATDCDDTAFAVHPGVAETCDGVDQDCSGVADDGVPLGGPCSTGLVGRCALGVQTTCTNGQYVCTQIHAARGFDDPATPDDDDCDGDELAIYVDPNGSDANAGTPAAPKATVAGGLAAAASLGADVVYLVGGVHSTSAPISLVSGIDVIGGFSRSGNVWTWTGGMTTIEHDGTASSGRVIVLDADRITTTLAHVTVRARRSEDPGVDHYGLRAITSALHLVDVVIDVPAGTDGAAGAIGLAGLVGQPGGSWAVPGRQTCISDGVGTIVDGGEGGAWSQGRPGLGPYPGAPSWSYGGPGGAATVGGAPGIAGRLVVSAGYWADRGAIIAGNGQSGSGGAGGAAEQTGGMGIGGGGGSGACGGQRAGNGGSGGSSFGLFSILSDATTFEGVTISAGGGGRGGDGGRGGAGGPGSNGG
ncbi:putative metal-binding motif-containing protein, partial [Myxococcota bacterium]|nr:putative metal-binding motif-containing protein [Myxococcota bacterium]